MNVRLSALQRRLAALGDPSRFRIVVALAARERHVTELAALVRLSQSCTTRHVQALEALGLVRTRRAGRRVMTALEPDSPDAAALLALVRAHAAAPAVAAAAEAPPRPGPRRRGAPRTRAAALIVRETPPAVIVDAPDRAPTPAPASVTPHEGADDPPPARPAAPRPVLDDFLL